MLVLHDPSHLDPIRISYVLRFPSSRSPIMRSRFSVRRRLILIIFAVATSAKGVYTDTPPNDDLSADALLAAGTGTSKLDSKNSVKSRRIDETRKLLDL